MEEDASQTVSLQKAKRTIIHFFGVIPLKTKKKKSLKQKYIYRYFIQVHLKFSLGMRQS